MTTDATAPTDLAALTRTLQQSAIDLSRWGVDGNKRIADLWREIALGESSLTTAPLLRHVNVVIVLIYHDGRHLIEAAQRFRDGRIRRRNRAPAEKMLPGESYQQAALRCLAEELGVDAADVTLNTSSHRYTQRVEESHSYPGLLTRFELHTVEATVANLPTADFCTLNVEATQDPICGHVWHWTPGQ